MNERVDEIKNKILAGADINEVIQNVCYIKYIYVYTIWYIRFNMLYIQDGYTALIMASFEEKIDVISLFISYSNIDVNIQDNVSLHIYIYFNLQYQNIHQFIYIYL